MDAKVLVAYASKYGSTREIAEKIGVVLKDAGFAVDVLPADKVADVGPYRAVVLGSAVYIGGWRKAAAKFLKANERALAERPVWLFSSGPTGQGDPVELVKGWRFPQGAAARGRPRQARGNRHFPGSGVSREAERHRPLDDEERQGAGRRLPRLERHHGLGRIHRQKAQGRDSRFMIREERLMDIASRFRQFRVLFKHFFSRLFYNDLLKFEEQQRESQIVMLTLLAVAGMLVANVAYEPFLLFNLFDMTPADLWRYEVLLLTFSMAVAGVIAVASWDKLFLDPLDQINLRPLPISARVLFSGKFAGLLAFVVAVTLASNFFAISIAMFYPAEMLDSLVCGLAHGVAVILGGLFIFMAVALLQGLFMALLPPAFARRATVFAQMLLLLVFLSPFIWLPMLFRSLPALKADGSALFSFFPPLWFTGIFNRIIGIPDPVLGRAGRIGLAASALALLSYLLLSLLSLRKFVRGADAAPTGSRSFFRFPAGRRLFTALFLRQPIQAAVFSFFMQTLRRSREHKLKLTLFLALPVSVLLSQFAYVYLKKGFVGDTLDSFLVSLPLALHFFLIFGMRMAVGYPHTLPANFVFRVSESGTLRDYMTGLRKALFCSTVIPPLFLCLPLYLYFWGPLPAFLSVLYSLAIATLLLELCFFNFHKIPFAAEHVPGKFKLRYYWPVLLIAGYQYHLTFYGLGMSLRRHPDRYPVFFLLAVLVLTLVRIDRNRRMNEERLVFEEEPEPAMMTLGLD